MHCKAIPSDLGYQKQPCFYARAFLIDCINGKSTLMSLDYLLLNNV